MVKFQRGLLAEYALVLLVMIGTETTRFLPYARRDIPRGDVSLILIFNLDRYVQVFVRKVVKL